jgi:cytochrome c peroxidase
LIGKAIASFERSLLSANSAFDRWRYGGEPGALGAGALRGFALFTGKAACSACHLIGARDALFTDHGFHNTGIGYRAGPARGDDFDDRGRQEVTQDPADLRRFKAPTLRNVARTAPYMHDGSLRSLQDVVRYYNAGGSQDPTQDAAIHPLGLADGEIGDLVAFLESLTGDNLDCLATEARNAKDGN